MQNFDMNITRQIWRIVPFLSTLALLCGIQAARADSVAQVQTTKYFAPETVAMIKQRVQDVANGVPGATLGFKSGDPISYIIQFTPIANTSTVGAGGYITDYIPTGTVVIGASFVQPDGAGGFYSVAPPTSAQMATDNALGTFTSWTMDAATLAICTAAGRTATNCTGRFANLVADTGIFYSTDSRTGVFTDPSTDGRVRQWGTAVGGNGYYVFPARGGTQLPPKMGAPAGALPTTHNYWDAAMTTAFGTATAQAVTSPTATNTRVVGAGTGAAPFNAASPVAGPDTGYKLDYTGSVGPWQRISYSGSTIGPTGLPATGVVGANSVVGTSTSAGSSFPLPSNTNAVRWAAGRLVVGSQSYVKITLQLTTAPPSAGLVNNSEVFGGDGSPESGLTAAPGGNGNVDNPWVYHVPSVASNVSTLFVLKDIVCVYDATGSCVANNGANLPITGTPATVGPKVRYRISYINSNNGTQHNVVICDQLPNGATLTPVMTPAQVPFASVTQVSALPNIGTPVSPAAVACGFAAGGTTFSYPVIPVFAGGAAGIVEFDVQYPLFAAGNAGDALTNTAKAVSTELATGVTSFVPSNLVSSSSANLTISKNVSPSNANKGDTVTYTVTVSNLGSLPANLTTLVDTLPGAATAVVLNQVPSRFNYVSTTSITVNGAPLSGVTTAVTPPIAPVTANNEIVTWTFPSGATVPAGGQMVVTFTATMGGSLATNVMVNATAYSNTAVINCSTACVLAPVAPNTTTSKTTGATAPVTLTIPNLTVVKTIDCVFVGAVCTSGSYVAGSSIPPSAKLRYKIVYSNPEASAQTITLTDTLPASTTAAGNLYVASGPDIRPNTSLPLLSVNPAAAGAIRGADAALTTIPASSVVTFTAANLPANSSGTLYIDVQTNAITGAVANSASISSLQRTAALGTAIPAATVSANVAALTITKTSNITTVAAGGTVIYTITVTNPTALPVTLTSITDTLPRPSVGTIQCATTAPTCLAVTTVTMNGGAAMVTGAAAPNAKPTNTWVAQTALIGQLNTWTFVAGSNVLNAGQSAVLTFTATYSATVPSGATYLNNATVTAAAVVSSTGSVAPVSVPYNTLSVSKAVVTPVTASIAPNTAVTYAITVTNTGTTPVPVTTIVDSLPAATVGTITYASTTSVMNGVANLTATTTVAPLPAVAVAGSQQAVTWTLPAATSIPVGGSITITFIAQFGAIPTNVVYPNDVVVNFTGGTTPSVIQQNLAPVTVPPLSKITKTINCVYDTQPIPVCQPYTDGNPIPVSAKLGYKIVYENLSAVAASGITITDILPTQIVLAPNPITNLVINGVTAAVPAAVANPAATTLMTAGTLTAAPSAGATGTITFDLQTNAVAGAGVTNTGNMVTAQDPLGVTSLATAQAAGGNLTVSKAVTSLTPSTVAQGGTASYTITVTNSGSASATLNTLVDTLPGTGAVANLTTRFAYAATGVTKLNNAVVTSPVPVVTMPIPNKDVITWTFAGGLPIPAGQTLTLTFTATVGTAMVNTTPGVTYYNDVTANYTGGAFASATANGQAPVYVPFATLTMSKTIDCVYDAPTLPALPTCQPYVVNAPIPPAAKLRYKLLYANILPAVQLVTIKDTLPASAIAAGNLYVGSGLEVRPSSPALSQNAALAGAARGADVALTTIAPSTVVVMTAVSLPANSTGSLFIDVQTNAVAGGSVSNCAIITTAPANTCAVPGVGVTSTSATSVANVAVLNISKATSTPNVAPGGTATYTITITNTGTAPTQTLAVYDFLPFSGGVVDATKRLAYVVASSSYTGGLSAPTITTAIAPTVAPYSSNVNQQQVKWDFGAFPLAANATATITFNATVGSAMPPVSYYNSARHEYTSAGIGFNGNANNQALITINNAMPSLTFLKMVTVFSDPVNGTTTPKFIPGAVAMYSLIVTNSGTGAVDNNTVIITDPVPANTEMYVADIAPGAGPLVFTNGTPSSGTTYAYNAAALSSTATTPPFPDLQFFGGAVPAWGYVPVPDPVTGCDPLVSQIRINPKSIFVASAAPPNPSFTLQFRVCVK
jgi:uncharacterized repeat protein (TIGR01451 family)